MLFMVLGPINYLLDLVWMSNEAQRQALRDKFADTYVVKKRATPVGSGELIHGYYEILCYNFLFREVVIHESSETGRPKRSERVQKTLDALRIRAHNKTEQVQI
jgi:hypothetical protein